ncbi:MAG: class I mannose-6-phosphate isomerase [Prevotella sp.]|nr:class I mannose-6-phosphate isomerase [Prevotella sp.]
MYKFEPLLKQTLWGGDKIIPFKHLDAQLENVGESWEISGVKDNETIVADGEYKGRSLNDLVRELKGKLVGEDNYQRFGDEFPLLIKFIDARQDLSIQVHPTDEIAHRQGKPRGKTEMWYCLGEQGNHNSQFSILNSQLPQLYNGLKQQITPEQYKEMVENDTITDALARYEVHEGDVFFIPAGRIHAIGAGCFVAEIQQTSDVTYRIYDFKRKDKNGNYRELHTKEAAESINYTVLDNYRTDYTLPKNEGVQVVQCPYFTTAVYDLTEPMTLDYSELDSFVILIAVKGEGTLTADGETVTFQTGDTVLLPATTTEVKVEGEVKFLETYV